MRPARFERIQQVLDRRQPDLTVLMERVHKPHNLSAILRNCDAVGVLGVHAVATERGIKLHRDTSGGTARWMGLQLHPDGPAAVRALKESGFRIVAADPGEGAKDFRAVSYTAPTALVVGAELYGIAEETLALVDERVRIPMAGMVRSLNVSVATALLLYEAYRQRDAAGMYDRSRLDGATRRRLLFEWSYPKMARRLREAGLSYPRLGADGAILEPSADRSSSGGAGRR
jgi:tRNA (guanosine-2'-O-)-methyltransferase